MQLSLFDFIDRRYANRCSCGEPILSTQTFCSLRCKKRALVQNYKDIIWKIKSECSICGYSKSKRALQFHHVDPSEKEYTFSRANHRSLKRIVSEAMKCIVVCANCHTEIHEAELDGKPMDLEQYRAVMRKKLIGLYRDVVADVESFGELHFAEEMGG